MRPWGTRRLFRFTERTRDDIHADIDEVAVYGVALSAERVRAHFEAGRG